MEKTVKVITLHQPYATLLAYGIKMNETRPKPTSHTAEKGIYLIHAAKKWTKKQNDLCLIEPFKSNLEGLGYPASLESNYASVNGLDGIIFPLGQIIGSFEVKECAKIQCRANSNPSYWLNDENNNPDLNFVNDYKEIAFGDYQENRYIWIGQNHQVLQYPILYKGSQGYYSKFKGDINQLKFL